MCSFELIWKLWQNDEYFGFLVQINIFLFICSKICSFKLIWKLWQNYENFGFLVQINIFLFICFKMCSFELIWKMWQNNKNSSYSSNEYFLLIIVLKCVRLNYFGNCSKIIKILALVKMNIFLFICSKFCSFELFKEFPTF